jgi:hypothetical protein
MNNNDTDTGEYLSVEQFEDYLPIFRQTPVLYTPD